MKDSLEIVKVESHSDGISADLHTISEKESDSEVYLGAAGGGGADSTAISHGKSVLGTFSSQDTGRKMGAIGNEEAVTGKIARGQALFSRWIKYVNHASLFDRDNTEIQEVKFITDFLFTVATKVAPTGDSVSDRKQIMSLKDKSITKASFTIEERVKLLDFSIKYSKLPTAIHNPENHEIFRVLANLTFSSSRQHSYPSYIDLRLNWWSAAYYHFLKRTKISIYIMNEAIGKLQQLEGLEASLHQVTTSMLLAKFCDSLPDFDMSKLNEELAIADRQLESLRLKTSHHSGVDEDETTLKQPSKRAHIRKTSSSLARDPGEDDDYAEIEEHERHKTLDCVATATESATVGKSGSIVDMPALVAGLRSSTAGSAMISSCIETPDAKEIKTYGATVMAHTALHGVRLRHIAPLSTATVDRSDTAKIVADVKAESQTSVTESNAGARCQGDIVSSTVSVASVETSRFRENQGSSSKPLRGR